MSGYSGDRNHLSGGKPSGRIEFMEVNSNMEWNRKPKVATDGSFSFVSSGQKDNSSHTCPSIPGQMSKANREPPSDFPFRLESRVPDVKDMASGMENLKLMPQLPHRTSSSSKRSKQVGSVSASGSKLEESSLFSSQSEPSHRHLSVVKSQKDRQSDMTAETSLVSACSKLKDSPLFSSRSDTCYKDSSAVLSHTGRSDMAAETHFECAYLVSNYSTPAKSSLSVDSGVDNSLSEKGKHSGPVSQQKAGASGRSQNSNSSTPAPPYDICPKRHGVVKLKAPLLVKNRERRNEIKQSAAGQNIILLRPGMVLLKRYISSAEQISIVKACRDLGISKGGFYQPGYRDGATLSLKMMCLGKHWDPQSGNYVDVRPIDNAKPPEIPNAFQGLVREAIKESNTHIQKNSTKVDSKNTIPSMSPNICIVNFYTKGGSLGLHQDKDESPESLDRGLPVVSFSIGDSAEFLYGDERDIDKAEKIILESGDVLIFGGKSRRIFHGVASILLETAPSTLLEATDLRQPGRLNLTFREF